LRKTTPEAMRLELSKITADLEKKEEARLAAQSEADSLRKKLDLWKGLNSFVQTEMQSTN